jgi:hypothetical protein
VNDTLQWLLAEFIVGCFAVLCLKTTFRNWARFPPTEPGSGYPDDRQFRVGISTLADECKAAEAFAERAKALNLAYLDSMKALDDKASAILGFVGGGSGLIALAAGTDKLTRPAMTPLLILASIFLFSMMANCVAVLYPRRRGSVNIEQLCDVALLQSSAGKSRIDAIIGREHLEAARKAARVVRQKGFYLALAQVCFAFGIATLVTNALLPPLAARTAATTAPTVVTCTVKNGAFDCRMTPSKETK